MKNTTEKTIEIIEYFKKIDELTKNYPNDMELGKRVRELIHKFKTVTNK
jgi:hypothetical protein